MQIKCTSCQLHCLSGPRNLNDYKSALAFIDTKRAPVTHYQSEVKTNPQRVRPGWKSFDSVCGIENREAGDRIIGGNEASPNQWPWQVPLQKQTLF